MKGKVITSVLLVCSIVFFSCSDSTDGSKDSDYSKSLNGKIKGESFTYSKAFFENDVEEFKVDIWGDEGKNITANTSSDFDIYPYIELYLESTITSKSFNVTTSGSGTNGIQVICWTSAFAGSLLDSGKMEVNKEDENTIQIMFIDCRTTDNKTILNGTCEIKKW